MPLAPPDQRLVWRDGQPYSAEFGDIYFSSDNGLEETRHVFLQHNRLAQRWQTLTAVHFTIVETGFGTGLNFLCAWALWRKSAPKTARLHFVSVERYPLTHEDLRRALALWPELAELSTSLLEAYDTTAPGWHRLQFDAGRVCLTLVIGDALDMLPRLKAGVDAWFLDGFAPARNPEMWQDALFREMARLSRPGATFATFTSAGAVKRGLRAAGFEVLKTAGFGRKREMLCGSLSEDIQASLATPDHAATGMKRTTAPVPCALALPDAAGKAAPHAIVIGAGSAGASSAHALARRGWQVTLLERHEAVAREASGNPQAMLYPRLAGQDIVLSRLAMHGYLNTLRLITSCGLSQAHYAQCGLLQTAFDADERVRCEAVAARRLPETLVHYVDAETASDIAGLPLQHSALYFPKGG
ncbi:MAG TPA: tRNA (5-methylaminomethyl-2-thiouridine)(34)-methyltransferase MnmD, partial [Methylophilaceae bacterium]|nr:tRNA (5-methylaminomethyl-2-thiouridine)(34)-methyltransferase MnmD [Methylophilaceae bacterium]